MRNRVIWACLSLAALTSGSASHVLAQALPSGVTARPVQGDPGISFVTALDDPAFRVLRNYAEPGATRRMHNHPESSFHVFILLTGALRVSVEGEEPREMHAGDVLSIKAGANHSFTNIGTVVATAAEVFGKRPAPAK